MLSDEAFRQMVFDIDAAFLATGKACRPIDRTPGDTRQMKAREREREISNVSSTDRGSPGGS